jgi:hypothetical protein
MGGEVVNPLALLAGLVAVGILFVAAIFWTRVRSDKYEAAHRLDRPEGRPPPRQLTSRSQDFDEFGRSW